MNLGRPGLSVLPLGVGDAFSAIHHPTCMLVSRYQNPAWDNDMILIDCPQSIRKMMREADDGRFHGLDLHRVNTLVLTHLHADHAGGLETIAAFFKIALKRKLKLLALPEVLEGVPRFLEAIKGLGTMEELFDIQELPVDEEGTELELGDAKIKIQARKTNHSIPTSALKISTDERVFAYSCDTVFDETLWRWLWGEHVGPEETVNKDGSKTLHLGKGGPGFTQRLVFHEVGHGVVHTEYNELMKCLNDTFQEWARKVYQPVSVHEMLVNSLRLIHYPDDMFPMLETSDIALAREGKLVIV